MKRFVYLFVIINFILIISGCKLSDDKGVKEFFDETIDVTSWKMELDDLAFTEDIVPLDIEYISENPNIRFEKTVINYETKYYCFVTPTETEQVIPVKTILTDNKKGKTAEGLKQFIIHEKNYYIADIMSYGMEKKWEKFSEDEVRYYSKSVYEPSNSLKVTTEISATFDYKEMILSYRYYNFTSKGWNNEKTSFSLNYDIKNKIINSKGESMPIAISGLEHNYEPVENCSYILPYIEYVDNYFLYTGQTQYLSGLKEYDIDELYMPNKYGIDYSFYGLQLLEDVTEDVFCIPEYLYGKKIDTIAPEGFMGKLKCDTLIIPSSINYIGKDAFKECEVRKVIIKGNFEYDQTIFENCSIEEVVYDCEEYTSVGPGLFLNQTNLQSVTLDTNVTNVYDYAFANCNQLKTIIIPGSVEMIGSYAFWYCSSLSSVTILDGVKTIKAAAFSNCDSLKVVEIPSSVTKVEKQAFVECNNLESLTIPFVNANGFGYIFGATSYKDNKNYVPDSLKEVIVLGGENIVEYAFNECVYLERIIIKDGVSSIERFAFYNCVSLETLILSETVDNIGTRITYGCDSLKYNTYDSGLYLGNGVNPYFALVSVIDENISGININENTIILRDLIFSDCNNLISVVIPGNIKTISDYAFSSCSKLKSVTISEGVEVISSHAFIFCRKLERVSLPQSLKAIESNAFSYCDVLDNVVIPTNITTINYSTFSGCKGLTNITIPRSVTSIESNAFDKCDSLKNVYYKGQKTEWLKIDIGSSNWDLTSATIYYNS